MLPRDFLIQLARKYDLAPKQEEAFVTLFSRNDDNDLGAAASLHISHSAFSSRMTGVYRKFSIGGEGAGKSNKLKNFLLQEYAKINPTQASSITKASNLDTLVREVRAKVSASIQKRCGTMRVLDMKQPITIDSIYTSVNILEKISRNQRRTVDELLEGCDRENFDRFILGAVKQQRIPGLEAVEKHDKLLILGKPGAGKTTFLKWLALQCKEGKLNKVRVPFFVTLKEFAEADAQPTLINFLARQLMECKVEDENPTIERILQDGMAIVLLDGLDEVRSSDHDRVLNTICKTSEQFDKNQFVITCRIAATEYIFEQFTEVEIANFNDEQIAKFAIQWFQSKDPIKAKEFPQELKAHPCLQELATHPLLLTFLCLVFEKTGGRFPANRSELYEEGLNVLLKKWDNNRNIKRDEVYNQLSLQQKKDLLSQIACITFESSDYFFKQRFVEEQIQDYIRNLPNASNNHEALKLDSEAIFTSIAAQHGLLVERSKGIHSFSHLTFHEYFTARQFEEKFDGDFSNLVCHVTDKQWREVFLLTVGMLKNADELLQAMKQKIDCIISQDEKLQEFLVWVEQKSCCVEAPYKSAAIRAFYFDNERGSILGHQHQYDDRYNYSLARDIDKHLAHDLDKNLNLTAALLLRNKRIQHYSLQDLCKILTLADDLNLDFNITNALSHVMSIVNDIRYIDSKDPRTFEIMMMLMTDNSHYLNLDLDIIDLIASTKSPELRQLLQSIEHQLPNIYLDNKSDCLQWWQSEGQAWIDKLRIIMILCRDIGRDWKFDRVQHLLIHEYYIANKLLVDCLNSDCDVSWEVRESIESTLLLPIESIEKYQPK